jgi:hypothetical protein
MRFHPLLLLIAAQLACSEPREAPAAERMLPPDQASIAAADSEYNAWDQSVQAAADIPEAELAEALSSLGYSPASIKAVTPANPNRSTSDRLWKAKNHIYGFFPARLSGATGAQPLSDATSIEPDGNLAGQALRITIDRVRVKKYPGRGTHSIAFFCHARTQVGSEAIPVEYGVGLEATEGDVAPLASITMFDGIRMVGSHVNLACGTVNVDTRKDQTFFSILSGQALTQGLRLLDSTQPALAPLTELTRGVRKELQNQNKGVPVQKFEIGLDLSSVSGRIKLREGNYLAIQIPPEEATGWNWADWAFDDGRIIRNGNPLSILEYNYILIGVSKA